MAEQELLTSLKKSIDLILHPNTFPTFDKLDSTTEVLLVLEFLIISSFLVGFISGNYSQVDKLWSLCPWIYVFMFAYDNGDPRLALMFIATFFWGIRLTLNFNRRGGYAWPPWSGEEDYRWAHIRKQYKAEEYPILFQIFHFVAICAWQHIVLFLIAAPAQVVHYYGPKVPLGPLDYIATMIIIGLVIFEGKADNEQFEFQEVKYDMINQGIPKEELPYPYSDGFLHSGLFALSRHPNYFAEQGIWIVFNLYVISASGYKDFYSWSIIGGLNLVFIFVISVDLQEGITKKKWPIYNKYIMQVPKLFPYGSGMHLDD